MIFVAGDRVKYHGDVQGNALNIIIAGDLAVVYRGNDEPEDDVWVTLNDAAPIPVDSNDLEWLSGKP